MNFLFSFRRRRTDTALRELRNGRDARSEWAEAHRHVVNCA
jgi:hypothetical protein